MQGNPRLYPEGVADEGPLPTTHYFRAAPVAAFGLFLSLLRHSDDDSSSRT